MASNFGIGSTTSPCRTSSAEPAQLVEEYGKTNFFFFSFFFKKHFTVLSVLLNAKLMHLLLTPFKDGKGNTDPEKLLQCPFDKNHKITR